MTVQYHAFDEILNHMNLCDDDFLCLTQAMAAIETLLLNCWVPRLQQKLLQHES